MIFGRDGKVRTTEGWTFHGRSKQDPSPKSRNNFSAPPRANVLAAIRATAARHERNRVLRQLGLGPDDWLALFCALIEAESAYRPTAKSPKGAYGLGQLMAATARGLGVDRTDVAQNLDGAARYLLAQLARFKDIELALAAYNAGPHRIEEFGGVPPFSETRNYIARVNRIRARLLSTAIQDTDGVTTGEIMRPLVALNLN